MKKLYSIVLMATALLVGTNAMAAITNWAQLKDAMQAGGTVTLTAPITASVGATDAIWIGSETLEGDAQDVILDLAGNDITINPTAAAINPFVLTKGSLKIISATPAKIEVVASSTIVGKSTNVISVFGAPDSKKIDPKGNNPFTLLEIGENVTVQTQNGTAVAVDVVRAGNGAIKNLATKPNYATTTSGNYGLVNGARIDVKGNLTSQGADNAADEKKCYGIKVNGLVATPANADDKAYAPYVHIHPSAVVLADQRSDMAGAAAVYASGFAQWLIEGNCSGATGVYISSGILTINDATIKSAADTWNAATGSGHANGSGSAIVINSRNQMAGEVVVTISGDTKAESDSGYAFEEIANTTTTGTKVDSIKIEGGTFEGGDKGALVITPATATEAEVSVSGGNVGGTANVGTETLAEYLNDQGGTHATLVDDGSGHTILVISEGDAPTGAADFNSDATASVKWTGSSKDITGTFALKELEASEATAQVLTIKENATFTVERVVLGAKAQIVVEAGAKFIVTGEQGIVAPVVGNIILKNEGALLAADRKHATFLFNPAVTSNRHPNATVELTTYSFGNGSDDYQWERFGVPTWNALKDIATESTVRTRFTVYEGTAWKELGYLNPSGSEAPVNKADFTKPFATYNLLAYRNSSAAAPTYTFAGELVGNMNSELNVTTYWTPFTNSYSANLNVPALYAAVKAASIIDEYIYIAEPQGLGTYNWKAWDDETKGFATKTLAPMQAFILKKVYGSTQTEAVEMNYNSMVYAPAPVTAPARMAANNDYTARMCVVVANENGIWDDVQLRETETRTKEAEKYMNADVNIYATTAGKAAILAVENLENTYVGFSTVKGGKFTLNFTDVEGSEYTLIDHETGAQVAIVEGATYEFTAAANSANDYRFELVGAAKMPTAIENAEAVKSAKGIYTITGQFVGEMNVWNTLPAGIYVVNGEKRVK